MRPHRVVYAFVLTVFALFLLAPGSAMAGTLDSEVEVTELTGGNSEEPVEEKVLKMEFGAKSGFIVKCEVVSATGKIVGSKKEAAVFTNKAFPLAFEWTKCEIFGLVVGFGFNGCKFNYGELSGTSFPLAAKNVKIECEPGKEIFVGVSVPGCGWKIPAQTLKGTATLTNKGTGSTRDVTLAQSFEKIKYTGFGEGCGPNETLEDATLKFNLTIKGYRNVSHTEQVGIFGTL